MGQIRIMTPPDGDKSVKWDAKDSSSVEKAKKEFEKLKEKGYKLYKTVQQSVRTGEPVAEFDSSVEEYVAVPAMAGG